MNTNATISSIVHSANLNASSICNDKSTVSGALIPELYE